MPFPENGPSVSKSVLHPQEKVVNRGGVGGAQKETQATKPDISPLGEFPQRRSLWDKTKNLVRTPVRKVVTLGTTAAVATAIGFAADRGSSNQQDAVSKKDISPGTTLLVPAPELPVSTPPTTEAPLTDEQKEQKKVDEYLSKAGYPELKGRTPAFRHDIETNDANIHVLSFGDALQPGEFDKDAYADTRKNLEALAAERRTFTWNPLKEGGSVQSRQYVPRRNEGEPKHETFIIITGKNEPKPQRLVAHAASFNSPQLTAALRNDDTVFYTLNNPDGATEFIRFTEDRSYQFGTSIEPNGPLTKAQQINLGLISEAILSTGTVTPYSQDAMESLKLTLSQLVLGLKQNGQSGSLMDRRLGRAVSPDVPWSYLPASERAQLLGDIFANAARKPSVMAA